MKRSLETSMVYILKFLTLFSFCSVVRGGGEGIYKMLVRTAKPDQTASSDLGLHCLSRPFLQGTSVRNFRTFTVHL